MSDKANELAKLNAPQFLRNDTVVALATKVLGTEESARTVLSGALSLYNATPQLANVKPQSFYNAVISSASLGLPVDKNLGFAAIIPYKDQAQLQIMVKGFKQLAIRSGQFEILNYGEVREGELGERDRETGEISFTWVDDDEKRSSLPVIGYFAYYRLKNGFSKRLYMSNHQIKEHAQKFSQTYRSGKGVWYENYEAMAKKTVVKLLLSSGEAPLSPQLQQAIVEDQRVDGIYADNKPALEVEHREVVDGEVIQAETNQGDNNE
jgi:recombination protein RecT